MTKLLLLVVSLLVGPAIQPPRFVVSHELQRSRIERALDLLRDDVTDASHTVPPLTTSQVVSFTLNWHRIARETVIRSDVGWEKILAAQLTAYMSDLGPTYQDFLQPDVDLINALMK